MSDPTQPREPIRRARSTNRRVAVSVGVIVIVLALVVGGASLLRTEAGTNRGRTDGPAASTSSSPSTQPSTPTRTPAATPPIVPGGRNYRYIWTGTPGRQFTEHELRSLARHDALVIVAKAHGTSFRDDDAAARRLVSLDPHVTVLVNFLAGALPPVLADRWGSAFDDAWLLRDANGDPIGDCSGGGCQYRVDVADPGYRRFLIGQVEERLRAAPYAGVMYDNLHYYDQRQYPDMPDSEIRRLNAGFRSLLRETRHALGPNQVVFFNGVSRNIGHVTVADRGFDLLAMANGAQDETFCYLDNQNRFHGGRAMIEDDRRYHRLAAHGSTILESVHLETAAARADAAHIQRYCFAHYLMSFVPGYTFVQFKAFPDQAEGQQISSNDTPEQGLALGAPVGTFDRRGSVLRRRFEHGWVFVNTGTSAATISIPGNVTLRNGGTNGGRYARGDSYTIPAQDAAFFLSPTP
ncbi:MAG: putative glycoside hydrolase [Actinomycetota bacterium]